ncbi:MAG TPA: YraN family protein [Longimicrobiales bacterium]|nr:YraN family protein [Longimicrobiales bacterium]
MASQHELGRTGEAVAAAYLEARGWTVVDRNYRFGHKEVDLVVRRGRTVAFVEVKARASDRHGDPIFAVTIAKRREIERVALVWITRHGRPGDEYRFDVVTVIHNAAQTQISHVEDAWRGG